MADVFHIVRATTHQKPMSDQHTLLRLYVALPTFLHSGELLCHRVRELVSLEFSQGSRVTESKLTSMGQTLIKERQETKRARREILSFS